MIILLNDQSTLDLYASGVLVLNDQVLGPNGQATTRVSLLSGTLHSKVHETAGGPAPDFEVRCPTRLRPCVRPVSKPPINTELSRRGMINMWAASYPRLHSGRPGA